MSLPGEHNTIPSLQTATVGGIVNNNGCAGMTGGAFVNTTTNVTSDFLGPKAGYGGIESGSNCGKVSQNGGNLGAVESTNAAYGFSEVPNMGEFKGSYAPVTQINTQCGGKKVKLCSKVKDVKKYSEVSAFWKSICPGSVMLYHTHLKNLHHKHHSKVLEIIHSYTRAFCSEIKALSSKTKTEAKHHLSILKSHLHAAEKKLEKLAPNSLSSHKMIASRHIHTVKHHIDHMKKHTAKKHKLSKKTHSKSKSNKKTHSKKHTKKHTRKNMKGGYAQYSTNVPRTLSYGLDGNGVLPHGPNANPIPITQNNTCVDNYNHFTGKGAKSPILDQTVNA